MVLVARFRTTPDQFVHKSRNTLRLRVGSIFWLNQRKFLCCCCFLIIFLSLSLNSTAFGCVIQCLSLKRKGKAFAIRARSTETQRLCLCYSVHRTETPCISVHRTETPCISVHRTETPLFSLPAFMRMIHAHNYAHHSAAQLRMML
jgi:hypothetical protein